MEKEYPLWIRVLAKYPRLMAFWIWLHGREYRRRAYALARFMLWLREAGQ